MKNRSLKLSLSKHHGNHLHVDKIYLRMLHMCIAYYCIQTTIFVIQVQLHVWIQHIIFNSNHCFLFIVSCTEVKCVSNNITLDSYLTRYIQRNLFFRCFEGYKRKTCTTSVPICLYIIQRVDSRITYRLRYYLKLQHQFAWISISA